MKYYYTVEHKKNDQIRETHYCATEEDAVLLAKGIAGGYRRIGNVKNIPIYGDGPQIIFEIELVPENDPSQIFPQLAPPNVCITVTRKVFEVPALKRPIVSWDDIKTLTAKEAIKLIDKIGAKTDKETAEKLEITPQSICGWRKNPQTKLTSGTSKKIAAMVFDTLRKYYRDDENEIINMLLAKPRRVRKTLKIDRAAKDVCDTYMLHILYKQHYICPCSSDNCSGALCYDGKKYYIESINATCPVDQDEAKRIEKEWQKLKK